MRLKQHPPGTSKRVIAGGSFWIKGSQAEVLNNAILSCAKKWLDEEVWDNEQLMLREVIPTIHANFRFIRKGRRDTAQVARSMLENDWRDNAFSSSLINWMMR